MVQNNLYYNLFVRNFFDDLPYNIVKNYGRDDNYLVKIENEKVRDELFSDRYDYDIVDEKICEIARKIFEEHECKIYLIVYNDNQRNIFLSTKEEKSKDAINYSIVIRDNNSLSKKRKKIIIKELKNISLYNNQTYSNDEIVFFNEKYKKDKIKNLKVTKDISISLDTPEEITFFYHNYRLIKMKKNQIKYAKYIIDKLNSLFEKVYNEKDILQYNGVEIELLNQLEKELFEHKKSMLEINEKIMLK